MAGIDQRAALERLVRERREDYAGLSRLIGRNAAYIQQFIKRGVPRKLDSDDLEILARHFGVSEAELGGRPVPASADGMERVRRLDVDASAGPGALGEERSAAGHIAFDPLWLKHLSGGRPGDLSFIRVQGDSMEPTLADGDDILVDTGTHAKRLRDGIYVLRRDEVLMVKRLAPNPAGGTVTIRSDNPAYPEWPDCDPASFELIGRVIWAGRRLI